MKNTIDEKLATDAALWVLYDPESWDESPTGKALSFWEDIRGRIKDHQDSHGLTGERLSVHASKIVATWHLEKNGTKLPD